MANQSYFRFRHDNKIKYKHNIKYMCWAMRVSYMYISGFLNDALDISYWQMAANDKVFLNKSQCYCQP